MDDVRNRLDQDLKTAVSRLGHLTGAAAMEERPWTIPDSRPCADEIDRIQVNERREVGLATRELLMKRVKRRTRCPFTRRTVRAKRTVMCEFRAH